MGEAELTVLEVLPADRARRSSPLADMEEALGLAASYLGGDSPVDWTHAPDSSSPQDDAMDQRWPSQDVALADTWHRDDPDVLVLPAGDMQQLDEEGLFSSSPLHYDLLDGGFAALSLDAAASREDVEGSSLEASAAEAAHAIPGLHMLDDIDTEAQDALAPGACRRRMSCACCACATWCFQSANPSRHLTTAAWIVQVLVCFPLSQPCHSVLPLQHPIPSHRLNFLHPLTWLQQRQTH